MALVLAVWYIIERLFRPLANSKVRLQPRTHQGGWTAGDEGHLKAMSIKSIREISE